MTKKMIALLVVVSVILVGAWYVVVFSSQSKSIRNANAATSSANNQANTLRAQISTLQQEKAQLATSTAKLTALKLALPDVPALDKLIDDINGAAITSGVDWQNISPAKPATYTVTGTQAVGTSLTGGMQAVTVTLQVAGTSVPQLLSFITKLDGMSRLLDVTTVNLAENSPKPSAQLTTQMFFVPPPPGSVTTTTVAP
jgi:Tfp pilus assembly protein PilO